MALSGDLRNIKLADIFQTLGMNRQVGILVLRKGPVEKRVFFSGSGVSLFSRRTIPGFRLGRHLVGMGKATPEQIENAVQVQERRKGLLGEVLIELGVCTADDIEQIVRYHVAEELYDLFTWDHGTFEFLESTEVAKASPEAAPFSTVSFDVAGVILEAARRIDEWDRVRMALPDEGAFLVQTGTEGPALDPEVWGFDSVALYGLVDGTRSVREILEDYHLARFETASVLAELAREGLIRLATVDELSATAKKAADREDFALAARLLSFAQPLKADDPDLLVRLADAREAAGARREAAAALAELGALHAVHGRPGDAVNCLERAVKLDPGSPVAAQSLVSVYCGVGDLARAAENALRAVENHIAQGHFDAAADIGQSALQFAPHHAGLRACVASACLSAGNTQEALTHFEGLAATYEAEGDLARFAPVCQRILELDPARSDLALRLQVLKDVHARRRRRRLAGLGLAGTGALGVIVAAFLLFTGGIDAEETLSAGWRSLQGGDLAGAEALARSVLAEEDEGEGADAARNLLTAVSRRRTQAGGPMAQAREEADRLLKAGLVPARDAFAAGSFGEGFDRLLAFTGQLEGPEATELLKRLPAATASKLKEEVLKGVGALVTQYADALDSDLQRLQTRLWPVRRAVDTKLRPEERRDHCAAANEARLATAPEERHRNLDSAETVLLRAKQADQALPKRMRKTSEGLDALHADAEVLYHRLRAPMRRDEVFDSFTIVRQALAESLLQGRLEQASEQCSSFLSACRELREEKPEEFYGPVVRELFADDSLDLDGKVSRDFAQVQGVLDRIAEGEALVAQGRIAEANGLFLTTIRDNYRVNLRDRVRLAVRVTTLPAGAEVALLRDGEPPSDLGAAPAAGILVRYPAHGTTRLVARRPTFELLEVSLEEAMEDRPAELRLRLDKTPTWFSDEGGPVESPPAIVGDGVLVPSRDGHLRVFGVEAGRLAQDFDARLLSGFTGAPRILGTTVVLVSPDSSLVGIDLAGRSTAWVYRTAARIRSEPVIAGDLLVVADEGGCVYGVREGREIWKTPLSAGVASSPAACSGLVFAATTEGRVYALEASSGRVRWERDRGTAVLAPLAAAPGLVLVGSEDSAIVALSPDSGEVLWRTPLDNAPRGRPLVTEGRVVVATLAGTIHRLDAANGRILGSFGTPDGAVFDRGVALSADMVYAVDSGGILYALTKEDRVLWSYNLGGRVLAAPVWADGRLFVALETGRLFCFTE